MDKYKFKTIMSRVGISYFILLLLSNLSQVVFVSITSIFFPGIENENYYIWIASYVPLYAVCVPLFWLIINILLPTKPYKKQALKFGAGHVVKVLIISFGATYMFNFLTIFIQTIITELTGAVMANPVEEMLTGSGLFWTAFFSCIVAPVGEEFLFRKVLFDKLGPLGDKVYIIMSGVLFGLFHANIAQMFYATALGMIFAYVYSKTCKIIYPILLHVIINFVGTVVSALSVDNEVLSMALGVFVVASILGGIAFFVIEIARKSIIIDISKIMLPQNYTKHMFLNFGVLAYTIFCLILSVVVIIMSS